MKLQYNNFKNRFFNLDKNTNLEKTHLWQVYLRIISILITTYIPSLVVYFFLFINPYYSETLKSNAIESLGYTMNIIFICIYYSILFICQICAKLKWKINKSKDEKERKMWIDSGFFVLLTIIGFLLCIFIVLSIIYSQVRAYKMDSFHNISKGILHYMAMMIPIIVFNTIANFFINLSFTIDKIKSTWIIFLLYLISIIEIFLIFIFNTYINTTNIIVILLIPSLIISFVKMIGFTFIYYKKTQYFFYTNNQLRKNHKYYFPFLVSKKIYIKLFRRCITSIWFSLSYTFSIVIQSLFVKFAYSIDNKLSYLFTSQGFYILLFVKIIDYGLLYPIFLFSRAFNISMLEHENNNHKDIYAKLDRRSFLRKINFCLITILICLSFALYFSLDKITSSLFNNLQWYRSEGPKENQLFFGYKYSDIIPIFIKQNFLYGIISFFFVEHSINNRNIITKTDKPNKFVSWTAIVIQFFSYSFITYIFAFKLSYIFLGLSGFFISFGLYGIMIIMVVFSFDFIRKFNLYKIYFSDKMNNISKFNFLFSKWKIDRYIKTQNKTTQKYEISLYSINILILLSVFIYIVFEITKIFNVL